MNLPHLHKEEENGRQNQGLVTEIIASTGFQYQPIVAFLLGLFVLYSLQIESSLTRELLISSVIISCLLLISERADLPHNK